METKEKITYRNIMENRKKTGNPFESLNDHNYVFQYLKDATWAEDGEHIIESLCRDSKNRIATKRLLARQLIKHDDSQARVKDALAQASIAKTHAEKLCDHTDDITIGFLEAEDIVTEITAIAKQLNDEAKRAENKSRQAALNAQVLRLKAEIAEEEAQRFRDEAKAARQTAKIKNTEAQNATQNLEKKRKKVAIVEKHSEIAIYKSVMSEARAEKAKQRAKQDETQAEIEKLNAELDTIKSQNNLRRGRRRWL